MICPPERLGKIIAHCEEQKLKLIIGCNANAHYTIWGWTSTNQRGKSLLPFILIDGFEIAIKSNKPAFVTANLKEVLNMTICSRGTNDHIRNLHVSDELSCLDHKHIRLHIQCPTRRADRFRDPRERSWAGYIKSLES